MSIDKEALKALAEAANSVASDVNITMAVGTDPDEVKAVQDYLQQAMPRTILDLLEEIERLEAQVRLAGVAGEIAVHQAVGRAATDFGVAVLERDQLKAESEALRKDAERYRAIRDDIPHLDLGRAILDVQSSAEYDFAVDAVMAKERGK